MSEHTFESTAAQLPDMPWEEWYETRTPSVRARADEYPPGFYIHIPSGKIVQILAYTEEWPPEHPDEAEYSFSNVCVVCAADWVPVFDVPYSDLRRAERQ